MKRIMMINEIKHRIGKSTQIFRLKQLRFVPGELFVGLWQGGENYGLPNGSFSYGVWPLGKSVQWGGYRMHAPNGDLIGYRFDALENSYYSNGCIHFHDLLLDYMVNVGDPWTIEKLDEDELKDAIQSKSISQAQLNHVENFAEAFEDDPLRFLRMVDGCIEQCHSHTPKGYVSNTIGSSSAKPKMLFL